MRRPAAALLIVLLGCSHASNQSSRGRDQQRPTCVVLSVGGMKGVAEIGALIALRDAGVRFDCIAGNSMGSLVAGLYATAPDENLVDRFRTFRSNYVSRTKDDKIGGGVFGALVVGLLTGGAALPTLAAGLLGADNVESIDRDRVVLTLDEMFGYASIEKLPVPYVTFFQSKESVGPVPARSGNLARNIGWSIANPFIFPNLDVVADGKVDPGGDRLSAVPLEDTCRAFPGHRLIAINVTGRPAVHTTEMKCPFEEVRVDVGEVDAEALFSDDDRELERLVTIGWRSTAPHFGLPPEPVAGMRTMTGNQRQSTP